jgi:hypothetical protein
MSDVWYNAAAWAQAIGTIGAVIGSGWVAASAGRAAREQAAQQRIAAKTAALNLAVLAHTFVKRMHELLQDESWRGRLNHISVSHSLLANQQMLLSFPIESLEDPDAMVAFAFFPGGLAVAADLYAHLEEAVRAAEEDDPKEVFDHYIEQMGAMEQHLSDRLHELKAALKLPEAVSVAAGRAAMSFEPRHQSAHHFHSPRRGARRRTAAPR